MYGMMGIIEQTTVLVVPSIYSLIYAALVNSNNENVRYIFYLSSAILLLPVVLYL